MDYFLLLIGFLFLIKGADLMIEGASSLAKRYHLSDLVIGLTIVAFGTSAPELVVNVFASLRGNTDLAIANVLGSNIANTLLAIGGAAFISNLTVKKNTVFKEIPLCFLAAIMVLVVSNDFLIDGIAVSQISRIDGLVFLGFFAVFFFYTINMAVDLKEKSSEKAVVIPLSKSIIYILIGLVGLAFGGVWIVDGAIGVAGQLGMSEKLIGLTVIALGTSAPEIVTSMVSAYKGKTDIAIGNAVGSNIFNIFWVLGISSVISPLPFDVDLNMDMYVNILASSLLFLFLYVSNAKHVIKKVHGVMFVAIYVSYITFSVIRG